MLKYINCRKVLIFSQRRILMFLAGSFDVAVWAGVLVVLGRTGWLLWVVVTVMVT